MISLGFGADGKRIRRKVSGKTKATVQDRLKALHNDLEQASGPARTTPSGAPPKTG